jgi:hypothetical protein
MRRIVLAATILFAACNAAFAWGSSGHSIVGEIAQRRLDPAAQKGVAELLGSGASLASVASWADDVRASDPTTTRWHFVSIPGNVQTYDVARDCKLIEGQGDCIIAAIDRDMASVACPTLSLEQRARALKFLVHLVGDLHQPLHAMEDERGANGIEVTIVTQEGVHGDLPFNANLHQAWDETLIDKTTWSWGGYVDRLEAGWLKTADMAAVNAGTTIDWANDSHHLAIGLMKSVPSNIVLDDAYRKANLALLDQRLGLAGLRLATMLNTAFAAGRCPAP